MSALVSVIIPTYNRSQFITKAVDSVLSQTYKNIELIVVNDGSTDDTEEKLQPYIDRIIYRKKENGGASSAVNAGLKIAKGKYVARLDDDDLFMPEKIERQVEVFEQNPDVGMVTCDCFITDEIGRYTSLAESPDFSQYGPFVTLLLNYTLYQPTVMVRRECHDKVGFYRDNLAQDYEMFLRISRYFDVGVVRKPLAKYRRHSSNITVTRPNSEFRQQIKSFVVDIVDDAPLEKLFPAVASTSDPYRRSCACAAKGVLYLSGWGYERAEEHFNRALALFPQNSIPLVWLGIWNRSQKQFQLAEKYFDRIQGSDEVFSIAQRAKSLITVIQRNEDKGSRLLRDEIIKERMRLFRMTFDGISGEPSVKTSLYRTGVRQLGLSRYAVIADNYPNDGENVLFSTLTHAMVNIGDDLKALIQNPDQNIGGRYIGDIEALKKIGMLVDRKLDETLLARKWYEKVTANVSRLSSTILTTYDCNFRCRYCIEAGVIRPIYMDDQCADLLVDWLTSKVKKDGTRELKLTFYGGEPLLNTKPIHRISEQSHKFATENGVLVSSSIVTNGSLLDDELLQKLTKYGLKSVKVTVDGVREVHDSRRPFRNGSGSFDAIIGNIQRIPETINLVIQTNLDSENTDSFEQLLNFFEKLGLKDRIDDLVVRPVNQSLGSSFALTEQEETGCAKLSRLQNANELLRSRGFKFQSRGLSYKICGMNRGNDVVIIDPIGDIYSCAAFVGRKGFSIGNINDERPSQSQRLSADQLEACFQCTYFPVCGGGCRYSAYMLFGEHMMTYCEKDVVETETKELIKLEYDQKMRNAANV